MIEKYRAQIEIMVRALFAHRIHCDTNKLTAHNKGLYHRKWLEFPGFSICSIIYSIFKKNKYIYIFNKSIKSAYIKFNWINNNAILWPSNLHYNPETVQTFNTNESKWINDQWNKNHSHTKSQTKKTQRKKESQSSSQ